MYIYIYIYIYTYIHIYTSLCYDPNTVHKRMLTNRSRTVQKQATYELHAFVDETVREQPLTNKLLLLPSTA